MSLTNWTRCKIGDRIEFIYGKGLPKKKRNLSGKFPVYGSNGIVDFHDEFLVAEPSIIVGRKGAAGKIHITNKPFWPIDTTYFVTPPEDINLNFLFYYLQTLKLEKHDRSTAIPGLNREDAYSQELIYPSLEVQQQIVSKIEELFSELDKGIESLQKAKKLLKTYRQAVLKAAFEGKLVNENGKWEWVNIQRLAKGEKHSIKAGPFGSSLKKEFYVRDGYKIYGQEQVINNDPNYGNYCISKTKFKELESNKISPFDVLISLVGTVGKILILPENCKEGIINPRLIKISLNRDFYLPKFFKYYFEGPVAKAYYSSKASGTTMDVLNLGIIKGMSFPLCSLGLQEKIIQEIESRLSVCDHIEKGINDGLQPAEVLRQSILKKAFEGRLV